MIVVSLAASLSVLLNDFTQDDLGIIRASTRLHGFGEWKDMLTLPYWPPPALPDLYRPLLSLFLAFQYVAGNGAPAVFRVVSCLLYAGACAGVLRVAARMLPLPVALGVALLFAAHPVHVEAIALAVAQNEILVALLATLMVARYLDKRRREPDGALQPADWGLLLLGAAAAAFSKEQGLLLPLFLGAAEWCLVRGQSLRERIHLLWKGYAALALVGALALAARSAVLGSQRPAMIADALRDLTMRERALTMLQVVPEWFRLLTWPAHLRAEYSPNEFVASTTFGAVEAFGLALLIGAVVVAWLARRRMPVVTFGLLWCFIALLPVSNVVIPTGILIAERTLFLASAGFLLAAGGVAAGVLNVLDTRWSLSERAPLRYASIVVFAAVVLVGVTRSVRRERVWHDPFTLVAASLEDSPRSWRVQRQYGEMMFESGRPGDGIVGFLKAISLSPEPWRVRNRFAQRMRGVGADSVAFEELKRSNSEHPGEPETIVQIASVLITLGQYDETIRLADQIISAANAPDVMVYLRHVADSARTAKAPRGSVRLSLGM